MIVKNISRAALAILFLGTAVSPVKAQFEGKIVYNSYKVENDTRKLNDSYTVYVTPERILLQGENDYEFIGSIKTEGILVRLDYEDFIFLTGDKEVMKISKKNIDSMMEFFGQEEESSEIDPEGNIDIQSTDEMRDIKGYQCRKFIVRDKEEPDNHAVVWMTREIKINWGMLSDSWGTGNGGLYGSELPLGIIFEEGNFPMKMERYESGKLTQVTEAEEVSANSIARAMVQIPQGVKVLSFQDYLFQKMSKQR